MWILMPKYKIQVAFAIQVFRKNIITSEAINECLGNQF